MGVAAALLALADAGLKPGAADPDRSRHPLRHRLHALRAGGVLGRGGEVPGRGRPLPIHPLGHGRAGEDAAPVVLKYLPNMPASHLAIYTDFRGPNNSLTMREAAPTRPSARRTRSSAAAAPT